MLKLVTAFVALTVMSMSAYAQSDVETGRVQITFMKAAGEGNGNLFFDGQKYGLSINGIKIGGFRIKRIDLVGTASKLRSASDIISALILLPTPRARPSAMREWLSSQIRKALFLRSGG
jgi:hypothetical protein